MRGITRDTLAELIDRKVLIVYGLITVISALGFMIVGSMDISFQTQGFSQGDLSQLLGNPIVRMLNTFLYMLVFMTVMASAGLFPSMLVKGRIDFFLSRPISRTSLFLNRLLAVWLVYGGLIVACSTIVMLVAWLKTDMVDWSVIYLLLIHLAGFFVWLSISFLAGVVSGSTPMVIMSAFGVWLAQSLLSFHESVTALTNSEIIQAVVTGLYHAVPKTGEISDLALDLARGLPVDWMPLWTSLLVAVVLVIGTIGLFKQRNY